MSQIDTIVEQRLLAELSGYQGRNLANPPVLKSMHTTVMMTLVDIQEDYPAFDAKAKFDFVDNDPIVEVIWWIGIQGAQTTIEIRFNPLRIDRSKNDLIAAYERAMSIL